MGGTQSEPFGGVTQPPVLVGSGALPTAVDDLVKALSALPPMKKRVMGGACRPQTDRMVAFMKREFGFHNTNEQFVDGVRAFRLDKNLQTLPASHEFTFCSVDRHMRPIFSRKVRVQVKDDCNDSAGAPPATEGGAPTAVGQDVLGRKTEEAAAPVAQQTAVPTSAMGADPEAPADAPAFTETTVELPTWKMSAGEIRDWQASYRVFYDADKFDGEGGGGRGLVAKVLAGKSEAGFEAFQVKFMARISVNPIFCAFDAKIVPRETNDKAAGRVMLVSMCGVDFAGRRHDVDDIRVFIRNWKQVYHTTPDGSAPLAHGRDFFPLPYDSRATPDLDRALLLSTLKRMARLRLRAQDGLGVQVAGECGVGLGVFSGSGIGIADAVRATSVQALREVLEEEAFDSIQLVVVTLPVFCEGDNYFHFVDGFKTYVPWHILWCPGLAESPVYGVVRVRVAVRRYKGATPVLLLDQDMHAVALTAAASGFVTSELNPADSHGVVGEYWQNYGPGVEEKLALTTAALLTQHHVVNPRVLDPESYTAVAGCGGPKAR